RCYNRLLRPGLAQVLPNEAAPNTNLRRRFDQLDAAIDQWLKEQSPALLMGWASESGAKFVNILGIWLEKSHTNMDPINKAGDC
ncbi:MAG: hypothetical protein HYX68_23260, partial [Planctomycetes bacterium]|nr:hypothetical protein [Planctomycetota bacterium]